MGIIDIVLIVIFAITVITSAARGFVRSITGILAWILAGTLAIGFCSTVAEKVYETFLSEKVIATIDEKITVPDGTVELVDITSQVIDELPTFVINAAESVGIDTESIRKEASAFTVDERGAAVLIEENVARPLIQAALKAICFVLMFIFLSAILSLLLKPVEKIAKKLPLIKQANTLLGGALGILKAAVIIAVLSIILEIAASFGDSELSALVTQSQIVKLIIESKLSSSLFV